MNFFLKKKLKEYLQMYFDPNKAEPGYSLAISYGQGGARLSHDHSRQYAYVIQSLSLWREIQHGNFFFNLNSGKRKESIASSSLKHY